MKLIIGLGNPGEDYQSTRHNIGFSFLDYLNKKHSLGNFEFDKKLNADILKGKIEKGQVILIKPHSFVNKTGEVTLKAKNHFKTKPEDIIIVQDDLDIPFGNTKISFDRNSGGHRGIDSIMKSLKTKKFYRIRLGLSSPSLIKARRQSDKKRDEFVMKFVLSKFTSNEQEEIKTIFKEAYEKLLQII